MGFPFAALGAVAPLVGSLFSAGSQTRQANMNAQIAREDRAFQQRWNEQAQSNFESQFERGIYTRVKDARRSGISPLAAMGLPGAAPASFQTGRRGGVEVPDYGVQVQSALSGLAEAAERREDRKAAAEARLLEAQARRTEIELNESSRDLQRARIEEMARVQRNSLPTRQAEAEAGMAQVAKPKLTQNVVNNSKAKAASNEYKMLDNEVAENLESFPGLVYFLWQNWNKIRPQTPMDQASGLDYAERRHQQWLRAQEAIRKHKPKKDTRYRSKSGNW